MSYCTRSDIEYEYGVKNVAAWADLDGDANATTISNRILRAIAIADARIDDRLRESAVSFRVPYTNDAGTVPLTLMSIAVQIAGYRLSKGRGNRDYDGSGKPLSKFWADYQDALATLEEIANKTLTLEGAP